MSIDSKKEILTVKELKYNLNKSKSNDNLYISSIYFAPEENFLNSFPLLPYKQLSPLDTHASSKKKPLMSKLEKYFTQSGADNQNQPFFFKKNQSVKQDAENCPTITQSGFI